MYVCVCVSWWGTCLPVLKAAHGTCTTVPVSMVTASVLCSDLWLESTHPSSSLSWIHNITSVCLSVCLSFRPSLCYWIKRAVTYSIGIEVVESLKRCKTETLLLQTTNRKLYIRQSVLFPVYWSDFQSHLRIANHFGYDFHIVLQQDFYWNRALCHLCGLCTMAELVTRADIAAGVGIAFWRVCLSVCLSVL